LRAEAVLGLYLEEGVTYDDIASRVGISRQRVHQIITAALAEAAARTRGLAEFALERELLLIEGLIREAAQILLTKCEACGGDEADRSKCETCEKTGYLYDADIRLEAIDRIGDAQDRRIRLVGANRYPTAPAASHPSRGPYVEMLQLSDEDLAAERERLEVFLAAEST
jgi:hypothetical protein